MTDPELIALATLVNAETLQREATNTERLANGMGVAYDDDVPWPDLDTLHAELWRRGILKE